MRHLSTSDRTHDGTEHRCGRPCRLVASLAALLASCVPATEELVPRGAAGIIVEPSPATRGEPFVTEDGFTVRIETFAMSAWPRGAGALPRIWGTTTAQTFVPAVPVGSHRITIDLYEIYAGALGKAPMLDSTSDIPPSVLERFLRGADNPSSPSFIDSATNPYGPSVIVALRAERSGYAYRLDLALGRVAPRSRVPTTASKGDGASQSTIEVRANDVSFARAETRAERLLMSSTGRTAFADIAAADDAADHDGNVTAAELRAVTLFDRECDFGEERLDGGSHDEGAAADAGAMPETGPNTRDPSALESCRTLLDELATRARSIPVALPTSPR